MGPHQDVFHVALLVHALRHVKAGDGAHLLEGGGGAARRRVGAEILLAAGVLDTGGEVPVHVDYLLARSESLAVEDVFTHGRGLRS